MKIEFKLQIFILAIIITIGAILRFYNLNWDQGYFFHPDENINIAQAAANLKPPFNPGIYTYGSFTIYLYRITANLVSLLSNDPIWLQADHINLIGRFYSAVFSTTIIIATYYLGRLIFSNLTALLAVIFVSFNVGLIQAAHFSTTETILTGMALMMAVAAILIQSDKNKIQGYLLSSIALGIGCGSKLTGLVFLPPFLLAHLLTLTKKNLLERNLLLISFLSLAFLIFFFVFPYSILDFNAFKLSFDREKAIADGTIPMFFTIQYKNTTPFIFQFTKIFPWILGIPILTLGSLGFLKVFLQSLKSKSKFLFIFLFIPLFYFIYVGSLFSKWTRYEIPLIPFFCLFAAAVLEHFYRNLTKFRVLTITFIVVIIIFQYFYALGFTSIYSKPDTRIAASDWIYQNLPFGSTLLLEPFDVVPLPLPLNTFTPNVYKPIEYNFYSLDNKNINQQNINLLDLSDKLSKSDFFIIGSRRIYANMLRLNNEYPASSKFYKLLFNKKLGYENVAQFISYPYFFGMDLIDDGAEETFQVFDHPKVLIYKNIQHLSKEIIYSQWLD